MPSNEFCGYTTATFLCEKSQQESFSVKVTSPEKKSREENLSRLVICLKGDQGGSAGKLVGDKNGLFLVNHWNFSLGTKSI